MSDPLAALFDRGNVIVCCGTGGVGKTSVAASLGIHAAEHGIAAVVVTVDPARRLASALGLADTGNERHRIANVGTDGGFLDIVMLDARAMFDEVVEAEANSPEQAHAILNNPMYRSIAGALGGTQEYMAAELLHQLLESKEYGAIVIDTPPSRHALDLLDAPMRITRLLDNRVVRLLMLPARTTLRAAGGALNAVLKTLGKVIGGAVLSDTVAFLRSFDGMEDGFRTRARSVDAVLRSPTTQYVIVTSTEPEPVRESAYFVEELRARERSVAAVVVNCRAPLADIPSTVQEEIDALAGDEMAPGTGATAAALLRQASADAEEAVRVLAPLRSLTLDTPWLGIPWRAQDVHDVAGLRWMSDQISPVAFLP